MLLIGFIIFVLAMLALDLGVFQRNPHEVHPREALTWTIVWVLLAMAFAGGLALFSPTHSALSFITGYVLEESLSIDNIFVIVLIFEFFRVPKSYQHRVLFYGVLGALVMRGLFIGLGAALLERFDWVLYIFGALLVITAIRMAFRKEEAFNGEDNPLVRFIRRVLPVSENYDGKKFFTIENSRRVATPLLVVLVLVEFTDLVFAVDSIPAIFGVTRDSFVVFTSNIFAVLGLRSLFFVLAAVVDKFTLLKYGLAVILAFIGAKMLANDVVHIGTGVSLAVVLGVLALSIVGSALRDARSRPATRD
jgi:tellurite resistance protein TerC